MSSVCAGTPLYETIVTHGDFYGCIQIHEPNITLLRNLVNLSVRSFKSVP